MKFGLILKRVGEKLNCTDSYLKFKSEIEQRLEKLKQKSQQLIKRPSVVCVEWIDPLMIAANWVPELVDIAGGINLLTKPGLILIFSIGFNYRNQILEFRNYDAMDLI